MFLLPVAIVVSVSNCLSVSVYLWLSVFLSLCMFVCVCLFVAVVVYACLSPSQKFLSNVHTRIQFFFSVRSLLHVLWGAPDIHAVLFFLPPLSGSDLSPTCTWASQSQLHQWTMVRIRAQTA